MICIVPHLYVGTQQDYVDHVEGKEGWWVVHAAKEPYHRQLLGYTGRGAPKDHPEYLIARRGQRLILNLIDVPDPKFIRKEIVDAALDFMMEARAQEPRPNVLVHCNKGESRAPAIALLYLLKVGLLGSITLGEAEAKFQAEYPDYAPGAGVRGFLQENWLNYGGSIFPQLPKEGS